MFLAMIIAVSVATAQTIGEGARELPPDSTRTPLQPDSTHLFQLSDAYATPMARTFALRNPFHTPTKEHEYSIEGYQHSFHPQQYVVHAYLLKWDTGRLWGDNYQEVLPAMGTFANASLMGQQAFGDRLTLLGTVGLNKYAGLYNYATVAGSLTYDFTPQVSGTVFGMWQSPSFMSNYNLAARGQYGGFITLKTENRKWGIDMGARNEYNPYTGHFDATPIIMPYYNLQGQKLGFDFGGLLKSIIINHQMQKSMQNGMPPMGPMGPMHPMHPMHP